jgi:lysophospholipase L1-like esterase
MARVLACGIALAVAANSAAAQQVVAAPAVAPSPKPDYVPDGQIIKYDKDIAAFREADRTTPPPKNGILFIGSSIFRQWENLGQQMAPLPVYNRAFGGSRTWEVLHYVDQVVIPYAPAFVVYYCGSNDVNVNQSAEGISMRIQAFFDRVHEKLPNAQLFYVDIQKAPDKRARWAVVDSANAAVRRYASSRSAYMRTIDLNPVLFDHAGNPRGDLYRPDSLHFLPPAYVEFSAVIKPVLEQAWAQHSAKHGR